MFNDKAADFSVVGFTGVLVHRGTNGTKRQPVFYMVIFHDFNALHRFKIISVADFEWHFILAALANDFTIGISIFGAKVGFGFGSDAVYDSVEWNVHASHCLYWVRFHCVLGHLYGGGQDWVQILPVTRYCCF